MFPATALGNFFFRYRAFIAVPFFIVLVLLSRRPWSLIPSAVLTLLGLALRSWAAGYIGKGSRGNVIAAEYRIVSGPYRFYGHPIYLGNLLLVLGTVLLFNPGSFFSILIVFLFLVEYGVIIKAEDAFLETTAPKQVVFSFRNLIHELSTAAVMVIIYAVFFLKNVIF